ncbi:MAG: response regulator [Proteobacteria bacterium]|nr:MAG: response regulator [Pseudomonadota bacterium]
MIQAAVCTTTIICFPNEMHPFRNGNIAMERRKPVVLILDDVIENVKVLGSLLGRDKYSLLLASSGQQAIQLALANLPDVLLLDVMVPDIDGISVCRYLKAKPQFANIPIIFLTANANPKDISLAYDAGGADYVLKPFHARELRVRVETQLDIKLTRDRLAGAEKLLTNAYHLVQQDWQDEVDSASTPFLKELEKFMKWPSKIRELEN